MKKTEKIFNVETGEETVIERDETLFEKNLTKQFQAYVISQEAEIGQIQEAKSALLEKLGITEDEAKLLLS